MILIPQAPSVWGLLPGCILASSGPCLLQKLIQQTAPGRPNSLLFFFFFFADDSSITSSQSSGHHQPLQGCSAITPACSQLTQRSLSHTEGESTGVPC